MTDVTTPRRRESCLRSLAERYPGLVCDLDGVVYRGSEPVPGAVDALNHLIVTGVSVTFATNNASRPPEDVRAHLRALGVAEAYDVVTSSQAGASYLAEMLPAESAVLAVGGPGVSQALREAGLQPYDTETLDGVTPSAVMQGLGTEVTWRELAEVAYLVQRGTPWVATNLDLMLPTARGPAPGNGALVAAVRSATDAVPHVVGKPGPALFERARATLGTTREQTLACGDRLDTDIAGAHAAGIDSLLVLSGACSLRDAALADVGERPTYIYGSLAGILTPLPRIADAAVEHVEVGDDGVPLLTDGAVGPQHVASLLKAVWTALDAGLKVSRDPAAWADLEQRLSVKV